MNILFAFVLTGMLNYKLMKGDAAPVARRGRPPLQEVRLAPEVKMMKDELSTELGAPVEIRKTAHNGSISITFFSEEELENILRKLGGGRD